MTELFLTLSRRVTALFRHRHLEEDMSAEMRSHLDMAIDLNIRKGMREEEAGREPSLLEVAARDGARNRRFPCAGHATQPKEALLVFAISPS